MKSIVRILTAFGVILFFISIFLAVLRYDILSLGLLALSVVFGVTASLIERVRRRNEIMNIADKYFKNEKK